MTTMDTQTKDWRYSEDRLELRGKCLQVLLNKYGGAQINEVGYSTQDIFDCADLWVTQGNKTTTGIVAFFKGYFIKDENQTSN